MGTVTRILNPGMQRQLGRLVWLISGEPFAIAKNTYLQISFDRVDDEYEARLLIAGNGNLFETSISAPAWINPLHWDGICVLPIAMDYENERPKKVLINIIYVSSYKVRGLLNV